MPAGPTLTLSVPLGLSVGDNPALTPFGVVSVNGTLATGDGSSPAGRVVTLSDNGVTLATLLPIVTDAQGQFSATVALPGLNNTLVASAQDGSGITGSSSPTPVPGHTDASLFGITTHDPNTVAGHVYALYEAILGRAPDPLGFENTVTAVNSGTSLDAVAQGMLSSAEYTADYGAIGQRAPNDAIATLYQNALGRSPDLVGLLGWDAQMTLGASEAQVAQGIAFSGESIGRLQPTFQAGVFVPDETDSSVARLYYGLLGRAPDAGGLQSFEAVARQGVSLANIADGFLSSPEYMAASAGQTNTQFVQALYAGALGRAPDAGGQAWVAALDAGATRANVALGIAESPEARANLAQYIEVGHKLL